jgi:hypothetical protein
MGAINRLIMNGTLCDECGRLIDDVVVQGTKELKPGPGYQRKCGWCRKEKEGAR